VINLIIGVFFEDFKKLADGKRVYYYKGENFFDFLYLVDGILVKSTVSSSGISNPQQFFSDKLFYGAIQLSFRIPEPNGDSITNVPLKLPTRAVIQKVQSEERKNTDIQREGVE